MMIYRFYSMRPCAPGRPGKKNGNGLIDIRHYEEIHTMEHALSQHPEEALMGMGEEDLLLTKRFFQALTETDPGNRRIRQPAKLNDVAARMGAKPDKIWEIVQNSAQTAVHSSSSPLKTGGKIR